MLEMDYLRDKLSRVKNQHISQKLTLNQLTGDRKEPSLTSRIKDIVDHAGPSQSQVPLKDVSSLKLENLPPFQNKISWIAHNLTETTAAKVV